jgi:hypothetical protein
MVGLYHKPYCRKFLQRMTPLKCESERNWSAKLKHKLRGDHTPIACLREGAMVVTLIAQVSRWTLSMGVTCRGFLLTS